MCYLRWGSDVERNWLGIWSVWIWFELYSYRQYGGEVREHLLRQIMEVLDWEKNRRPRVE